MERENEKMANRWKEIWEKRGAKIGGKGNIFELFCELKKADGFDTQDVDEYYEAFWKEWEELNEQIRAGCQGKVDSLFEVGCGSGVNLLLFQKISSLSVVGGMDYSPALLDIARQVVESEDIFCGEACDLDTSRRYDVVLANSVFQYFPDENYGMEVLKKMCSKANKMVVITEIHDLAKQEEHMRYRRAEVENYDEKYKDLEKTFYSRERLTDFAKQGGWGYRIVEPHNEIYWNNAYVFDFYLYL